MADGHEDSPYWPFVNTDPGECYGPGPKGGKNCRADRWKCKCRQVSPNLSICKCRSTRILKNGKLSRARKTVRIDLRKKRAYQRDSLRPFLRRRSR